MSAGNTGSTKAFINSFSNRRYSGASNSSSASPPPAAGGAAATGSAAGSPSSPRGSGQFAGLMAQKRGSECEGYKARRASWDEQKPAPGVVGGWWNKMMKG